MITVPDLLKPAVQDICRIPLPVKIPLKEQASIHKILLIQRDHTESGQLCLDKGLLHMKRMS